MRFCSTFDGTLCSRYKNRAASFAASSDKDIFGLSVINECVIIKNNMPVATIPKYLYYNVERSSVLEK